MCRPLIYNKPSLPFYPSARLPASSPPPLFSPHPPHNKCHSFQSGEKGRKWGRAGTQTVTEPQQLTQPMEFRGFASVDFFFFLTFTCFVFFLFSSYMPLLSLTFLSQGPPSLSSSNYFAWFAVLVWVCVCICVCV